MGNEQKLSSVNYIYIYICITLWNLSTEGVTCSIRRSIDFVNFLSNKCSLSAEISNTLIAVHQQVGTTDIEMSIWFMHCVTLLLQLSWGYRTTWRKWLLCTAFYCPEHTRGTFHGTKLQSENCALLGYYAAGSGNFLSTYGDNLSVPSSGFKNPEDRSFHLLLSGSLKSRKWQSVGHDAVKECYEMVIGLFHHGVRAPTELGPPHRSFMITLRHTGLVRRESSFWVISPKQGPLTHNTTLTTERHPFPRWDSNPQSQQASGHKPTH